MSKNKRGKKSVALGYEQGQAPTIVAKAENDLAEQIIALAKAENILVFEDEALSTFLHQFDLGEEIPKQLYQVIAELIGFSYVLQGKNPEHWVENGRHHINLKS